MSGRALISEKTANDLRIVARFFGIDMEWNAHIFRHAAQLDGPAFESVMSALAIAVQADSRFGITRRIRQNIAMEKRSK